MGKPTPFPRTSSRPPRVADYAVSGFVTVVAEVCASLFMALFFVMWLSDKLAARLRGEKPAPAKSDKGSDKSSEVVCILQERFPGWAVYQSKEAAPGSRQIQKRTAAGNAKSFR